MSLETWKKEFYPEEAGAFWKGGRTAREAVEHSLRKWRGTLPENLARHELLCEAGDAYFSPTLIDANLNIMAFGGNNCALCELAEGCADESGDIRGGKCDYCPLKNCSNEWSDALGGDTAPMIALLEGALEELDKDNQED